MCEAAHTVYSISVRSTDKKGYDYFEIELDYRVVKAITIDIIYQ